MAGKLTIVLGAVSTQDALALVVAQGFGNQTPRVIARARGATTGTELIPRRLKPGPAISARLTQRDVQVYRVRVPLVGEMILEACNATGTIVRKTSPFGPRPASLKSNPAGLSVVLASCTYYWQSYMNILGPRMRFGYGLGPTPSFALFVGDNVYLDVPKPKDQRPSDVVDRYLTYFLDDGYTAGRSSMPSFSTYDDHELWNDYPRRAIPVSLWLSENGVRGFRQAAHECLNLFQRSINPALEPGRLAYTIELDDLSFFVADTRSARSDPQIAPRFVMPPKDLDALVAWAGTLKAPGVLVLGQPLWIEPISQVGPIRGDHNISHFRVQYDRICKAIEDAPFDVLVLSGDVHYSRVLEITARNRRTFHEVVSSPLVSIPSDGASAVQMLFGGNKEPELDHDIGDTKMPPRAGWQAKYLMGTGLGASFGLLNFRAAGAGVNVGLAFVDLRLGRPANLARESSLGRASLVQPAAPQQAVCLATALTSLARRLP